MDLSSSLQFSTSDQSFLFLLQIACIVHMTDNWKKLKLRLFHFCQEEEKQQEIKSLLENLRIRGETVLCRDKPQEEEEDRLAVEQSDSRISNINRYLR